MELTRFQKILLAVLAGMLAVFGVLMAVLRAHPGAAFEGGLLKISEQDGETVYSGKVQGAPVTISVIHPTNFKTVVDFTIGGEIHDVCEVLYPTRPIETEHGYTVDGIRVTKNGTVLFEGGYDRDQGDEYFGWYTDNGEWTFWPSAGTQASDSGTGPWRYYETTVSQIVRFAFGPGTAAHGDPAFFAMAVFLSLLLAVDILFHKELFRWRHWAARDPEPAEGYLAFERAGWVILAAVIAAIYLWAMTEIY